MALATKFAAMISLTAARSETISRIVRDFIVHRRKRISDIDLEKLHALGQLVYTGGGRKSSRMFSEVRARLRISCTLQNAAYP